MVCAQDLIERKRERERERRINRKKIMWEGERSTSAWEREESENALIFFSKLNFKDNFCSVFSLPWKKYQPIELMVRALKTLEQKRWLFCRVGQLRVFSLQYHLPGNRYSSFNNTSKDRNQANFVSQYFVVLWGIFHGCKRLSSSWFACFWYLTILHFILIKLTNQQLLKKIV